MSADPEEQQQSHSIHPVFREFVEDELLPDLDIDASRFWAGLSAIVEDLSPQNEELLHERDVLQQRIDDYHDARQGEPWNAADYRHFLEQIGYLEDRGEPFEIDTENVDPEIASIAGPQLVVPVSNARFALNAANARWGSLYDALYGTDVIPSDDGCEPGHNRGVLQRRAAVECIHAAVGA